GSLAREKVKEDCEADWDYFDRTACRETVPGNNGKLMLPYFEPESTPLVLKPQVKYNFATATKAERIRAILESQALSMKLHSAWQAESINRIRITGGASGSEAFRQIIADVFQANVETIKVRNSAGLGAAMRAANAVGGISFEALYVAFAECIEIIKPNPSDAECYEQMLKSYAELERNEAGWDSSAK
ncbi:MAG: FGGY-family carbohydrate kinase, partial [Victivallales bacterium]|nr:FGGY-family carbohydrate kinase [Victivallales bacterium]